MTWVPNVFILCLVIETSSVILRFQGVAPSLTLDRIHILRDSIEKLQHINGKVRCRIKELSSTRSKRFIGPAQRLEDLIAPLSLNYAEVQDDC
ncbi:hypothetical protein V3C99_011809 [Haemonchus contortus]|nr:Protein C13A10.2 [Haemonchus contortus]CDJ91320.1 Protein C13A10.2 [Haemonchus contortus]